MGFRLFWAAMVGALSSLSLASRPAVADIGPYRPLDIRVRFENLADYPAYDFYLKYGLGRGNPYVSLHLTRAESGAERRLEGEGNWMTEVYLLAVPHGQQPPPAPPVGTEKGREWLEEVPSGALQSDPLPGKTPGSRLSGGKARKPVSYRVRIDGGRLQVDCTDEQTIEGNNPAGADSWWAVPAGLVACAVLAVGGLVWLSRARRTVRR